MIISPNTIQETQVFFSSKPHRGDFFFNKSFRLIAKLCTKNATIATPGAFVGIRDPSKSSQIRSEIPSRSLGRSWEAAKRLHSA